ncbi:MAG: signal peptidase I [Desulfurococcales archaeon]|nr:signal peptidase I [Desulfurococcales archaeon]
MQGGYGGSKGEGIAGKVIGYLIVIFVIASIILVVTGTVKIAVVEGISMEPTFHTGDMVFLKKTSPDNIKENDIVVYSRGTKYIIHRVIKVVKLPNGDYCYIVKGDNNPVPDPPEKPCKSGIPYTRIVGVVRTLHGIPFKVPYLGGISVAIRG